MARENLTLATIARLPNGENAVLEFDRLIRECAMDCAERREIDKPRKLVLQLTFAPNEEDIEVGIAVKHILPQRECGLVTGALDRSGKLMVNPASPDEPDQKTLDEAGE